MSPSNQITLEKARDVNYREIRYCEYNERADIGLIDIEETVEYQWNGIPLGG